MKTIALGFLLALSATVITAQDKPIIEATGALDRVLDDSGTVDVYLKLAADAKPPVITEVTRDGVAVSVNLFDIGLRTNVLHIVSRDLPKLAAGIYAIGIQIQPVAETHKASDFTIKVKRNVTAAEKATLTADTLRAERVVYVPGLCASWQPSRWTMQESSGKSGVTFETPKWTVSLKTAAPDPEVRTLRITADRAALAPGQTVELKADLVERSSPLGKMTGTFKVQAKELATPADVNIEVITRWSRWILFLLLSGSILLGWLTRTKLEDRRLVAAARIAANEERAREKEILRSVRDPHYAKLIDKIIKGLTGAISKSDVTAISNAVVGAKADITSASAEMVAKEKEARTLATQVRDAVFDGRGQTGVMQQLAENTIGRLSEIEKKLSRGLVDEPRGESEMLASQFPKDAADAIARWQEVMRGLVGELDKWPEALPGELASIETRIEAMGFADLAAVKSSFAGAAAINSILGARYEVTVAPNILDIAERIEEGLPAMARPKTIEKDLRDPSAARDALKNLHREIVDALTAAVPAGKAVPAEIAQNKFIDALAAVKRLEAADVVLNDATVPQPVAPPFTARLLGTEATEPGSLLHVTIEQDGPAVAGELLTLTLTGVPDKLVTAQWEAGELTYTGQVGELTFSFVPQASVPIEVKAHVVATIDGHVQKADTSKRIVPLPEDLFDIKSLQDDEQMAKRLQTAVASVLIILAGVFIVFKDWIGTPADILGAVFWGFAADISVAAVMTFAKK